MLADLLNVTVDAATIGGAAMCDTLQPPVGQLPSQLCTHTFLHIFRQILNVLRGLKPRIARSLQDCFVAWSRPIAVLTLPRGPDVINSRLGREEAFFPMTI